MTPAAKSAHPRWRRLMQLTAYAVGALVGLMLLVTVIVVIINRRDEPLTSEAGIWLRQPAVSVADSDNAWLAMLAAGFEQQSGPTTGRRFLDALNSQPPVLQNPDLKAATDFTAAYEKATHRLDGRFGPRWAPREDWRNACATNQGSGLFSRLAARLATDPALTRTHRAVLDRYYAAISLPGFEDEDVSATSVFERPEMADSVVAISAASCLARLDLTERLLHGDASARPLLTRHVRYWLTALQHGRSLIGSMLANAQVSNDIDWAGDLADKAPAAHGTVQALSADWQALGNASPESILAESYPRELRAWQTMLQDQQPADSAWQRFQFWVFFKPDATINLAHRLLVGDPETLRHECGFSLYNLWGKTIACMNVTALQDYPKRVGRTTAAAGLLVQGLNNKSSGQSRHDK